MLRDKTEPVHDREIMLSQFNRFVQDLLRDQVSRNCFCAWEIELLVDLQDCPLREASRRSTLLQYQKAGLRHLAKGFSTPLKFSDFFQQRRPKKTSA